MTTHLPEAAGAFLRFLLEEGGDTNSSNATAAAAADDQHADGGLYEHGGAGEMPPGLDQCEVDHGESHGEFGVHIAYEDLYNSFIFLTCIYVAGRLVKLIKMPDLVGQIIAGLLLGPNLAGFVPNPQGQSPCP